MLACKSTFHTTKFLVDHLTLYHDTPETATKFICGIDNFAAVSHSIEGFRTHLRRKHRDDWHQQRLKRKADTLALFSPSSPKSDLENPEALLNEVEITQSSDAVNFHCILQKKLALFALKHRELHCIPKSTMESIVREMHDIMIIGQNAFAQNLASMIPSCSVTQLDSIINENENILDDIFGTVSNRNLFKKFCVNHMHMIQPKEFALDVSYCNGRRTKTSFCYVPILETLRCFIEHEDVGTEMIRHARQAYLNTLCDYSDGDAYASHPLFGADKMAIRLHLYVDDFEVCNPIGSRRSVHKLTAVYFLIGNIHPKYWSSAANIHLALLARCKVVKSYGLQTVLKPLMDDISQLETNGISVKLCDDLIRLRGAVATISADNLGSHQIGGFRQTFSSGKICRFCTTDYKDIAQHVTEEMCFIRTADAHASHLDGIMNDETLCTTYGIKTVSPFASLTFFSVTESLPPDAMHDILEGLCPLNVQFVLLCLIKEKKLNAKSFNDKLDLFAFSKCDLTSKPSHIPDDFVSRGKLICSASQNWCLFRNLPFLLQDIVDLDAKYWILHLLCREICRIVFAPVIVKEWLIDLQQHIAEHHTLLAEVDVNLFTPKLHFFGSLSTTNEFVWSTETSVVHAF